MSADLIDVVSDYCCIIFRRYIIRRRLSLDCVVYNMCILSIDMRISLVDGNCHLQKIFSVLLQRVATRCVLSP